MIFVALGSNLPTIFGPPLATLIAARRALHAEGIAVIECASWYESAPVPASNQPWYVNSVVKIETALPPAVLLARLHAIEAAFGRTRGARNAARGLDLDLLDYNGQISESGPVLPHPRMTQRAFVLLPLAELAPAWRDPVSGIAITALIGRLDPAQTTRRIG